MKTVSKKRQMRVHPVRPDRSQEAIEASEARYRQLVELSPDAIIIHDGRRIVFANTAAAKMVGLEATPEIFARSLQDFIHPQDRHIAAERAVRMVVNQEVLPPVELRLIRLDGVERDVEANGGPITLLDGTKAVQTVIRDVTERRQADRWFRSLLESAPDAMVVSDREGKIRYVNSQAEAVFGYSREELIERRVEDLIPRRHRRAHRVHRAAYGQDPRLRAMGADLDLRGLRKDGTEFPVEIGLSPLETTQGNFTAAAIRDISERNRMQTELKQMSVALESAVEGISRIDAHRRYVSANAAYAKMVGYTSSELVGLDWLQTIHLEDHDTMMIAYKELLAGGRVEAEVRGVRKDNSQFHQRLVLVATLEDNGRLGGHYQFMQDISARKFNEELIRHMAYHDPLTNLPNRRLLYDRFRMALAQAKRSRQPLAIVSVDLDDFKDVNDALGHAAGDHLLRVLARYLTGAVREGDTVARVGGDEFVLLLPNADQPGAAVVVERLLDSASVRTHFEGERMDATFSVGVSVFPDDGDDPDQLIKLADAMMYRSKEGRLRLGHGAAKGS